MTGRSERERTSAQASLLDRLVDLRVADEQRHPENRDRQLDLVARIHLAFEAGAPALALLQHEGVALARLHDDARGKTERRHVAHQEAGTVRRRPDLRRGGSGGAGEEEQDQGEEQGPHQARMIPRSKWLKSLGRACARFVDEDFYT